MATLRRDAASTVLAGLVVLAYVANTHEWGFLGSNRWAAGAIGVLGMAMCSLGRASEGRWTATTIALSVVGGLALLLFVLAVVSSAQWLLALLAVVTLVLWAVATLRHAAIELMRRPPSPA